MKILHNIRLLHMTPSKCVVTERAAIAWVDAKITFAGPKSDLPKPLPGCEWIDGENMLATPALIDCHTHLVFGGNRADEFAARLGGASYQDIAATGGGIMSSVRQTRVQSEQQLVASGVQRARQLLAEGVGTIEIKSGYGLDLATETKMLRVATQIGVQTQQTVRRTYLALHAYSAFEYPVRADFINNASGPWLQALHAAGLVDAVDAFQETIAFTADEVTQLFEAAKALGLPVKLHADQLSASGGADLAARFGALSADHVEHTTRAGAEAMAAAGTVAVLLPTAFYCLRDTKLPPIDDFREFGVPMAIASDCNPGTSPCTSLRLAMHQACTLFGLSIPEALCGTTIHAARALGLHDRGELIAGQRADIALWTIDSPAELVYWLGHLSVRKLLLGGKQVLL
jgi:imidazolonepropionase